MVAPVGANAADGSLPFSSLPTPIYMITEPAKGSAPGTSTMLEVSRGDKGMVAIFSSKELADAFLGKIADAPARKLATNSFPRSFARDFQGYGASLVLNPLNMTDGGTPISPDAGKALEVKDDPELEAICREDQADRLPEEGKAIDWSVVGPRDARRLSRIKELYHAGKIVTGPDYFNAALVLQHGRVPEDYLLAHELAVVAISKGQANRASSLAAASEDRFLMAIGRKQRFGTQLTNPIIVDGDITDQLREELRVPPLGEEQEHAKSLWSATSAEPTPGSGVSACHASCWSGRRASRGPLGRRAALLGLRRGTGTMRPRGPRGVRKGARPRMCRRARGQGPPGCLRRRAARRRPRGGPFRSA